VANIRRHGQAQYHKKSWKRRKSEKRFSSIPKKPDTSSVQWERKKQLMRKKKKRGLQRPAALRRTIITPEKKDRKEAEWAWGQRRRHLRTLSFQKKSSPYKAHALGLNEQVRKLLPSYDRQGAAVKSELQEKTEYGRGQKRIDITTTHD